MPKKQRSFFAECYAVVRGIPRQRVLTYGDVARLAGVGRAARVVGYAMASAPTDVPWHRVVGKSRSGFARLTIKDPSTRALQRTLLEGEGIAFTAAGEIDLQVYGVAASG